MDGWMDGRTDVRTENLPILQDFVPYQGHCPKKRQDLSMKILNFKDHLPILDTALLLVHMTRQVTRFQFIEVFVVSLVILLINDRKRCFANNL